LRTSSLVGQVPYRSDGGAIYIEKTLKASLQDNSYRDLLAKSGGALYVSVDSNSKNALEQTFASRVKPNLTFKRETFINCQSEFLGGAVFMEDPFDA